MLWKKYISSQLYQLEFIQELRVSRELNNVDYAKYHPWVL
jgi:hypothetical protein